MIRLMVSYSTPEEKENIIADVSRLEHHKVLKLSKEYTGKGKSLYKKIYIDLIHK